MHRCPTPATLLAGALAIALTPFGAAHAGDAATEAGEPWAFSLAGTYGVPKNDDPFGVVFARASKGGLHLGARYNYEAPDSASVWAGRRFSYGEALEWSVMPMFAFVFGRTRGVAPGVEGILAWRRLDFYIEAQYLVDFDSKYDSILLVWSELAYSPTDRLRVGIAEQRTQLYRSEFDLQVGPFFQIDLGRGSVGAYLFNPGTGSQVTTATFRVVF